MLWVDKYRPQTLKELSLHQDVNNTFERLAATKDFPHLLVHGPSGAGKKTRVMALLRAHFGDAVNSMKLEHKTVPVSDSKSIDIATLSSPHHIDINPSDAGNYDRVIAMSMIREIAQTMPLVSMGSSAGGNTKVLTSRGQFKCVVLNEADKLTRGAQQALRRTMEKYMMTCRIILIASSTSRLIAPLRSRCFAIRVPGHEEVNVKDTLANICQKEALAEQPSPQFLSQIAIRSDGNLRRAVLMLEASKMSKVNMSGDGKDIPVPDWKKFLLEICDDILVEQTPKNLFNIRQKLYELLSQCIPAEIILQELMTLLIQNVTPKQQPMIAQLAAQYDHNMKRGTKPIMHLEAFVAQVMRCIKEGVN